jgi:hypothetical protein
LPHPRPSWAYILYVFHLQARISSLDLDLGAPWASNVPSNVNQLLARRGSPGGPASILRTGAPGIEAPCSGASVRGRRSSRRALRRSSQHRRLRLPAQCLRLHDQLPCLTMGWIGKPVVVGIRWRPHTLRVSRMRNPIAPRARDGSLGNYAARLVPLVCAVARAGLNGAAKILNARVCATGVARGAGPQGEGDAPGDRHRSDPWSFFMRLTM